MGRVGQGAFMVFLPGVLSHRFLREQGGRGLAHGVGEGRATFELGCTSGLQDSSQEPSLKSAEEVSSGAGNTPHPGQSAQSERSCRRASALINRGELLGRLRPATYSGSRPHLVASGAGPNNEPMGRGGRKTANGSGYGAGDTRLRANGVLWGGA